MMGTPARGYLAIPLSIVVAGILISAGLFFALSGPFLSCTTTATGSPSA